MKARILIVDDERDMVELLSFNLRKFGYDVIVARNGLEALKRARSFSPDLVLLDVMMDGMDGFTVCEILRRQPSTADTAIILVTACGGQMARFNGMASGADDFINKPFRPQDLLRRVEKVLEESRLRHESRHDDPFSGFKRTGSSLPPSSLC
jgi:DNA-binding response OmpR family regulator